MKSPEAACYYVPEGTTAEGAERVTPTPATAGPWAATAQHGGPPAALLGRAIERLATPGAVVGRFTMDLLGPVPLSPLLVTSRVLRPGRTVALLEAEIHDEAAERVCARAQAWTFPASEDGPGDPPAPGSSPEDGVERPRPEGWGAGYLDSVEWRWVGGVLSEPGPGVVWMRPRVPLVPEEEMTGLQRLLTCVDSASGVSSVLDIREWSFMNTELTVTVLRPPTGDWVCLDAVTTLGPGAVGLATSAVSDQTGLVARSSQTLLVTPSARRG